MQLLPVVNSQPNLHPVSGHHFEDHIKIDWDDPGNENICECDFILIEKEISELAIVDEGLSDDRLHIRSKLQIFLDIHRVVFAKLIIIA